MESYKEQNLAAWEGETLEFVSKRIAGILLQTKKVSIKVNFLIFPTLYSFFSLPFTP